MNIGFVTTWLERGATYVTKTYIDLLKSHHNTFVYARGGEKLEKGNPNFDTKEVTWGLRLGSTKIDWRNFSKWIKKNDLSVIFFNEQHDIINVLKIKKKYPHIKIGAYIDYYTEDTVEDFKIYDFLICNTKRHFDVFKWHKGAYYIPWGTNVGLFKNDDDNKVSDKKEIVFFHSVGMSSRKGTDILVNSFIDGEFYKKNAKLILHSQISLDHIISAEQASSCNVEIITKEVSPPGLYHLGDVYVYPTTLDGLGLTIYEALSSGMPVITTNDAPMNEVVNSENKNGKLVDVEFMRARKDGYYWPQAFVSKTSLVEAMDFYCLNSHRMSEFKKEARNFAEKNLEIKKREEQVREAFESSLNLKSEIKELNHWIKLNNNKKKKISRFYISEVLLPNFVKHFVRSKVEEKRNARGYH